MRDRLITLGRYAYLGLKDPLASLVYITSGSEGLRWLFFKRLLRINRDMVSGLLNELRQDAKFLEYVQSSLAEVGGHLGEIGEPEALYVTVRLLKPERIVETGVAAGVSSAFILKGLNDNGSGNLYSIDLPNYDTELVKRGVYEKAFTLLPSGRQPGFVIPTQLKNRWKLVIGKSHDVLEPLLNELGNIDVFLHDSEHTYENMYFEFETAWKHLKQDGLLLSHDISLNHSFFDFAHKMQKRPIVYYLDNFGAIRK